MIKKTFVAGLFLYASFASAGVLDFTLTKIDGRSKGFCTLYFDVVNNTGLNVTYGAIDVTSRESDGSIISKDTRVFKRIKKGDVEAIDGISSQDCGKIKTIKVSVVKVEVDGAWADKMVPLADSGKRKSKIAGVELK